VILQPVLPNSHPHLLVVYPVLTNEEMTTESQRYNCFTSNGGNAIPKHAGPEVKCSNPTTGLTLPWARNPFRVYPVLTNEEMTTESQRYKCFTSNGGNAIPKHAGPEVKCSNPTTGLTLPWAHNPFRGNFNHWKISRMQFVPHRKHPVSTTKTNQ